MAHGWCLASNQKLHAQRQHRVAHGASHRIKCCMQRSIAWQWYLASNQWMHARRQHCVAHGALHRVECCMPCSVAWDMPRFKINSCTPRTAAASRGTGMVPRFNAMAARTAAASCGTWIVPRLKSIAARHARRQHRVAHGSCLASNRLHIQQQHRVAHGSCLASNQWLHTTHGGSIAWHMDGASLEPMAARHTRRQHARRQHRVAHGRCLAPNQCLHTRRQHCVAHGWCPASTQWLHAMHGGSIAWHMDGASLQNQLLHALHCTNLLLHHGQQRSWWRTPNSCQERPTTSDWAVSASLPPS